MMIMVAIVHDDMMMVMLIMLMMNSTILPLPPALVPPKRTICSCFPPTNCSTAFLQCSITVAPPTILVKYQPSKPATPELLYAISRDLKNQTLLICSTGNTYSHLMFRISHVSVTGAVRHKNQMSSLPVTVWKR